MVTIFEAQLAPVVLSAGKLYIYLNNKMNRKNPKRHCTVIFFLSSKNWESFSFILYRIKCPALITKPTSKPQYVMGFYSNQCQHEVWHVAFLTTMENATFCSWLVVWTMWSSLGWGYCLYLSYWLQMNVSWDLIFIWKMIQNSCTDRLSIIESPCFVALSELRRLVSFIKALSRR